MKYTALPSNLPPRLISRAAAAEYYGVSPNTFDTMVADGRAPRPKVIGRRRLWDVRELDEAISALAYDGGDDDRNAWDDVLTSADGAGVRT